MFRNSQMSLVKGGTVCHTGGGLGIRYPVYCVSLTKNITLCFLIDKYMFLFFQTAYIFCLTIMKICMYIYICFSCSYV